MMLNEQLNSNLNVEKSSEALLSQKKINTLVADFTSQVRIKTLLNIEYAVKDGYSLHLHLLQPDYIKLENKKYPLIVFTQGSAWRKQNLGNELVQLGEIARRGYQVAIVQYRESDIAPFPAQTIDIKSAASFLITNAEQYQIDIKNIILWGDSSGAHTSLMVAATDENPNFKDEHCIIDSIKPKAVIDFYGPVNISTMHQESSDQDHVSADSPEGRLIGGKNIIGNFDLARTTDPTQYMDKNFPPTLIIHGNADNIVPYEQSVYLYHILIKLGIEVEMFNLHGAAHGGSAFWTKEIIDLVEEFIKKQLQK